MRKNKLSWASIVIFLPIVSLGFAQQREQRSDPAQAKAEKAMKAALKVMRDADKLRDKEIQC